VFCVLPISQLVFPPDVDLFDTFFEIPHNIAPETHSTRADAKIKFLLPNTLSQFCFCWPTMPRRNTKSVGIDFGKIRMHTNRPLTSISRVLFNNHTLLFECARVRNQFTQFHATVPVRIQRKLQVTSDEYKLFTGLTLLTKKSPATA
jgi:hypothetical protein